MWTDTKKRIAYLYILLVFLIVGSYLFKQGEIVGAEKYKYSKNMQWALKSAYRFGYFDGKAGRKMDWDNGEE